MANDLLTYIREREQSCRLRASLCPIFEQSTAWLDRAAEWAVLADEIARQRKSGKELAPLLPATAVLHLTDGDCATTSAGTKGNDARS